MSFFVKIEIGYLEAFCFENLKGGTAAHFPLPKLLRFAEQID
jgi:hypothetical protein